jgi:dTDP-4-amino-4,6-dideoxygalactose transaminase
MHVPFVHLKQQYQSIREEINAAVLEVLESGEYSSSRFIGEFEKAFAQMHDESSQVIATNSGTSALHATLLALNIGPGDEVLVPSHTFISTAMAVTLTGATPVFCDCDPEFYTISPDDVRRRITADTKAVIVVHLYGQPAEMDTLVAITKEHDVLLIEDCAQSHGAQYKAKATGLFGVAGCYSFYPSKNLGAYGEGGAVITKDVHLADKLRMIRSCGAREKYVHEVIGNNYRMTGIQGAILRVKSSYLQQWTNKRIHAAALYEHYLEGIPNITLPKTRPDTVHVFHLYVIMCPMRDALREYLSSHGVETGIHYPVPCHLQPVYQTSGVATESLPDSERCALEVLSLPMSEQLTETEIAYVASVIKDFMNKT